MQCPDWSATHVTPACLAGTTSISLMSPVQLACCGKSTFTSLPLGLSDTTVPTLLWFTEPHLYLGVVTEGLTRTRSPTLMIPRWAVDEANDPTDERSTSFEESQINWTDVTRGVIVRDIL